jgi:diphthine synthase
MSINTALQQLLEVESTRQEGAYGPDTTAVGMSRLGSPDQEIVAGSMQQLLEVDFGPPLHCLVIAGGWVGGGLLGVWRADERAVSGEGSLALHRQTQATSNHVNPVLLRVVCCCCLVCCQVMCM